MIKPIQSTVAAFASASLLSLALPAFGAAQRTFVASNGVDTNPCTVTLPCRGFTAALLLTNAGGEIIVLDSAGYGSVTINKAVSIIAPFSSSRCSRKYPSAGSMRARRVP